MNSLMHVVALALAACFAADEDWPQFRGPNARGVAVGKHPERWSATENVAWKTDLPGRGWSSPVVQNGKVFVTTVVNTGKAEAPKKGLYFGGDRPKPADSVHQWKVLCLDLATGSIRWERQVHEGRPKTPIHLKSSYASETPATDGERLYCLFGSVGLWCFDLEGKELWNHPLEPHAMRYGWGAAAPPVLHEGRLYVVNDNEKDSYLLALDARTGKEVWRTPRAEKSNWSTPYVWKHAARTEIVVPGTGKVRSYGLDGKLLWEFRGMSSITIATPYEHDGLLYVSSGYVGDSKRPLYAIRPGAAGDISLKSDQDSNEFIAWRKPKSAPYNPTTLAYEGRIYALYDFGSFGCFDAKTGKEIYAAKRLPGAKGFTASPWASNGRVYCLDEDGKTFVLKAGDKFDLVATNRLSDDDMGMATPAVVGDRLLIRTAARLYCIADRKSAAGAERNAGTEKNAGAETAFRFVNRTGGKFRDDECFWSLDQGKTWKSFAAEPTAPCVGNGRLYFHVGIQPRNFDDFSAYWDFIEFNFAQGMWHGNTTQVDAFCLPIVIELGGRKAGIDEPRSQLFAKFSSECPPEFRGCVQRDRWILSPHRAGFNADGPHAKYFDSYVDEVWATYAQEKRTPSGRFIGQVKDGALTFTPVDGGRDSKPITCPRKPNTQEILLGSGVLAQNPRFYAAFNRHVAADPADWNDAARFYQASPCNWYSKFLHEHSIGNKAYGFCYDDVADQSSFFSAKGKEVHVKIGWDEANYR